VRWVGEDQRESEEEWPAWYMAWKKYDHGFTFLRDAGHRMMQGWYQ
jgi:hypothetical protein